MVLLPDAGPIAEAFYAFLLGTEAHAILARHGFGVP
jgi:ABC-type molybdate transport system substrate-binding protein